MALLQVLFSPSAAFTGLRGRKWAWILPVVLTIALSLLSVILLLQRFSVTAIIEDQIAQSGQQMPAQGLGPAVGIAMAMMYVGPVFSTVLSVLILALLLFGIVKGFSGETTFPMMMNAAAYALFAFAVVGTVLFLTMFYTAPDLKSFQLQNPIPLNAGYFFTPQEAGKAGVALLSGINLVNFYLMGLLALGAARLSDRVSVGSVLWPLAGIYTVYTLGKAGLAALF